MVDFEYACKICGTILSPKSTIPHYVNKHPEMGNYAVPVATDEIEAEVRRMPKKAKPEPEEAEEEVEEIEEVERAPREEPAPKPRKRRGTRIPKPKLDEEDEDQELEIGDDDLLLPE